MNIRYTKFEKKVFQWIFTKRYNVLLFSLTFVLFSISPSLPYLNLFVTKSLIVFLIFLSFIVIFSLEIKVILSIILLFLILSAGLVLVDEFEAAELLGDYSYGFLLAGVVLFMLKPFRNN